jgi:hypothetical protein
MGDVRRAPANCFRDLDPCQHLDRQSPEGMHYSPSRDQARMLSKCSPMPPPMKIEQTNDQRMIRSKLGMKS